MKVPVYAHNRQWVGMLWRVGWAALLLAGLYVVWHWDPYAPPPLV